MKNREDLRHLCVCSVDPPGCTDIDDALHCRELSNGNLEVPIIVPILLARCDSVLGFIVFLNPGQNIKLYLQKLMGIC